MTGLLSGVRILELSRILAGPWAGQVLADMGAEVIKVENPNGGDDTRTWGPPFVTDLDGNAIGDLSAYFLCANRGKKSVCIDFTKPEGQEIVRKLAASCDVVIENFKVGGLKKYGLDYDSLKAVNPKLVYASITGFGQDGPYAHRAGYDFMIQGLGGLMSLTGQPDGEPVKVGVALTDVLTGLYTAIGVLSALHHARATGQGHYVDIALLDVQVATLANQALNYLVAGKAPKRLGNSHPNIVPYQAFPTLDGHIILAVGNDGQFARFCAVAGHPEWAEDERFATNPSRVAHRALLVPMVADALSARSSRDWLTALEAVGVPAGPINDIAQVFADPQVVARGLKVDKILADGTVLPGVGTPICVDGRRMVAEGAPPRLGAQSEDILEELLTRQ
ncbi:MAG TPA: CaiB/BaiF CoA-transferase family protein [Candidatus Sulfotelmatobacter sp.]|jgi:crotonobetainyl-CoA:carnitine CoA-transferase CaiB-like acyl-CoA transferase|nr:CaiB/BaiF CoA-transferase family protein [Candidatus Sulfotelmatobacter sp.]